MFNWDTVNVIVKTDEDLGNIIVVSIFIIKNYTKLNTLNYGINIRDVNQNLFNVVEKVTLEIL